MFKDGGYVMKKLICIPILILLVFTACNKNPSVVGVWQTYDIGVSIDSPEIPEYLTFVFKEDGTGSGPVGDFSRLDYPTFTYEVTDSVIKVHNDENRSFDIVYRFESDKLILTYDGYTRTLFRVSEN